MFGRKQKKDIAPLDDLRGIYDYITNHHEDMSDKYFDDAVYALHTCQQNELRRLKRQYRDLENIFERWNNTISYIKNKRTNRDEKEIENFIKKNLSEMDGVENETMSHKKY